MSDTNRRREFSAGRLERAAFICVGGKSLRAERRGEHTEGGNAYLPIDSKTDSFFSVLRVVGTARQPLPNQIETVESEALWPRSHLNVILRFIEWWPGDGSNESGGLLRTGCIYSDIRKPWRTQ